MNSVQQMEDGESAREANPKRPHVALGLCKDRKKVRYFLNFIKHTESYVNMKMAVCGPRQEAGIDLFPTALRRN